MGMYEITLVTLNVKIIKMGIMFFSIFQRKLLTEIQPCMFHS